MRARGGDLSLAESLLNRALKQRPGDVTALYLLSMTHCLQGRYRTAQAELRSAHQRRPDSSEIKFGLAYVSTALGKYQRAVDLLQQLLKLRPRYPAAHLLLADTLNKMGRTIEAQPAYSEFLRDVPSELTAEVPRVNEILARYADRKRERRTP